MYFNHKKRLVGLLLVPKDTFEDYNFLKSMITQKYGPPYKHKDTEMSDWLVWLDKRNDTRILCHTKDRVFLYFNSKRTRIKSDQLKRSLEDI